MTTTPPRRASFEARAARRNREIAARNRRAAEASPLFAQAGILDQVAQLDTRQWDALSVAYDEIARGVEIYQWRMELERKHRRDYAVYVQMLDEAIGAENREEVVADYAERWRGHAAMQQMEYRLNYLNNYLARYLKRTPGEIHEEAKRRAAGLEVSR